MPHAFLEGTNDTSVHLERTGVNDGESLKELDTIETSTMKNVGYDTRYVQMVHAYPARIRAKQRQSVFHQTTNVLFVYVQPILPAF